MTTLGDDIKDVFTEVGTAYNIIRDVETLSGEFLDETLNRQVTKPFVKEFFLEVSLPFDTRAVGGDVIQFTKDSRTFLIVHINPEDFENLSVTQESVLYKANVSGELLRPSGEGWDTDYHYQGDVMVSVRTPAYGLLTERLFGPDIEQDVVIGQIEIEGQSLYMPSHYGVKPLDRYQVGSGEYYKIEAVEERRFNGVDICKIVEDTRP